MISPILINFFRFLSLLLLQILVLNNIQLPGIFNPYVYVYFILLLPISISRWQLLFVSFFAGICIDLFTHSLGMHAFTCVLIGFIRPYILDLVKPSGGYNPEDRPTLGYMGFSWFLTYAIPIVFIHHLVLFLIETLSVNQLIFIFSKALMSSLFALIIIMLSELFFSKRPR